MTNKGAKVKPSLSVAVLLQRPLQKQQNAPSRVARGMRQPANSLQKQVEQAGPGGGAGESRVGLAR
jgi:hypothetical protein